MPKFLLIVLASNIWGLFLIAGIASLSALIFCMSMFFYKERQHNFKPLAQKTHYWEEFILPYELSLKETFARTHLERKHQRHC